jgi:hypothetical protein
VEDLPDPFHGWDLDRSRPLSILLNIKVWRRRILRPVTEPSVSRH